MENVDMTAFENRLQELQVQKVLERQKLELQKAKLDADYKKKLKAIKEKLDINEREILNLFPDGRTMTEVGLVDVGEEESRRTSWEKMAKENLKNYVKLLSNYTVVKKVRTILGISYVNEL